MDVEPASDLFEQVVEVALPDCQPRFLAAGDRHPPLPPYRDLAISAPGLAGVYQLNISIPPGAEGAFGSRTCTCPWQGSASGTVPPLPWPGRHRWRRIPLTSYRSGGMLPAGRLEEG